MPNTVMAPQRSKDRGIRGTDIAVAFEHSGYSPDEITQLYPDLSLGDGPRTMAYYDDTIEPASAYGRSSVLNASGFRSWTGNPGVPRAAGSAASSASSTYQSPDSR